MKDLFVIVAGLCFITGLVLMLITKNDIARAIIVVGYLYLIDKVDLE